MKGNAIMSDVELSYEELKCLDFHFRQIQKDAVVYTLKHSAAETAALLDKMVSQFKSTNQLESSAKIEP